MRILLDAHIHTNSSHDSTITPSQLLERMRMTGLNAVAITDHDNMEGYKRILHTSAFSDYLVVPGIEIMTDLGDIIVLGLQDPVISKEPQEVVDAAKEAGGLIVAPHPFDSRRGSLHENCSLLNLDMMETVNGKCGSDENRQAKEFAKALGLPCIGGSDAHEKMQIGTVANVVECEKNVDSLLSGLKKGVKILVRQKSALY